MRSPENGFLSIVQGTVASEILIQHKDKDKPKDPARTNCPLKFAMCRRIFSAEFLTKYYIYLLRYIYKVISGGVQPVRTDSTEPSHEISFHQRTGQHCRLNLYH